ncbi:MAG: hypothetical protein U9R08_02900 [Nanoarchaeota archaeon]|nr:hypothetical protein [Nanoarchaeota archaeon]
MANTITLKEIPAPANPSATLVAGGSLVDGTTYYYRVVGYGPSTGHYGGNSGKFWWSIPCTEVSATCDAVNKSIKLYWDDPGDCVAYMIYRTTVSGDYAFTSAHLVKANASSSVMYAAREGYEATASGAGWEWTDDGTKTLTTAPLMTDGVPCFEVKNLDTDELTPEDLYDWAVTNGKTYIFQLIETVTGAGAIGLKMTASMRTPEPVNTTNRVTFVIPERFVFIQIWGKHWFMNYSHIKTGNNTTFPTRGGIWIMAGGHYCGCYGSVTMYEAMFCGSAVPTYDLLFLNRSHGMHLYPQTGYTATLYDTIYDPETLGRITGSGEYDFKNVCLYPGSTEGFGPYNIIALDKITVKYVLGWHYAVRQAKITNSDFVYGWTYDVNSYNYNNNDKQSFLDNCTFPSGGAPTNRAYVRGGIYTSWIWLYERYPLDLTIVDRNGDAIQGATVELREGDDTVIWQDEGEYVNSTITTTTTDWTVSDGTAFTVGKYYRIVNEIIKVTAINGNVLTVTRAQKGTTARPYSAGMWMFFEEEELTTDANGETDRIWMYKRSWKVDQSAYGSIQWVVPDVHKNYTLLTLTVKKSGYITETLKFDPFGEKDYRIVLNKVLDINTSKRIKIITQ